MCKSASPTDGETHICVYIFSLLNCFCLSMNELLLPSSSLPAYNGQADQAVSVCLRKGKKRKKLSARSSGLQIKTYTTPARIIIGEIINLFSIFSALRTTSRTSDHSQNRSCDHRVLRTDRRVVVVISSTIAY